MNKNSIYIKLNPPYTLDKWKDGGALTREHREFQVLENYIPFDGSIAAREGIVPFAHTPEITIPTIPASTTNTYRLRMIVDFELGNALMGWNSAPGATGSNPIFTAMICPNYVDNETGTIGQATCEGAGFAAAKAGTGRMILDSAPATNIYASSPAQSYGLASRPGLPPDWYYTGTAPQTCILYTYWVWPYVKNDFDAEHIVVRQPSIAPAGLLFSMSYAFDADEYQIFFVNSAGTAYALEVGSALPSAQQWYFCAGWIDFPNRTYGIYIYDDVLKTERWTASSGAPLNATHHMYDKVATAIVTIGGTRNFDAVGGGHKISPATATRGHLDYITYWDLIPSVASSVVTLIKEVRDLHKAP